MVGWRGVLVWVDAMSMTKRILAMSSERQLLVSVINLEQVKRRVSKQFKVCHSEVKSKKEMWCIKTGKVGKFPDGKRSSSSTW